MKGRFFWTVQNCKKFTAVFESETIIIGRDKKKRFHTFRKDTGLIAYSKLEVLEMQLSDLTKKAKSVDLTEPDFSRIWKSNAETYEILTFETNLKLL